MDPNEELAFLRHALRGMAGYLQYATAQHQSADAIMWTLAHDIMGLARRDEAFSPRTWTYDTEYSG